MTVLFEKMLRKIRRIKRWWVNLRKMIMIYLSMILICIYPSV